MQGLKSNTNLSFPPRSAVLEPQHDNIIGQTDEGHREHRQQEELSRLGHDATVAAVEAAQRLLLAHPRASVAGGDINLLDSTADRPVLMHQIAISKYLGSIIDQGREIPRSEGRFFAHDLDLPSLHICAIFYGAQIFLSFFSSLRLRCVVTSLCANLHV